MSKIPFFLAVVISLSVMPVQAQETKSPKSKTSVTFETHIRPILKAHCFECHGEGKRLRGDLDLRLAKFAIKGGKHGPAIEAGKAKSSYLVERLRKKEMPPGEAKLTKEQIDLISRWIEKGAKTEHPEPDTLAKGFHITEQERNFWAFQPVKSPKVPKVKDQQRVRTPIDAFLLRKLQANGMTFSPDADRATLIRRVYLDLIGLPPTPAEVQAFLDDEAPDAYEKIVDRLLASKHYGERWGRHWLDVVGYADSEGVSNTDPVRQYMYKYRDYVIRAFNEDMPFDRFIREQLAGDEMVGTAFNELKTDDLQKLIATGFLRTVPDGTGTAGVDQKVARNQVMADTLQVVGSTFLGMTVHCAQCHNHRYDPISQVDYYKMRAIFEPAYDWKNWRNPRARLVTLFSKSDRDKAAQIEKQAVKIDRERLKKQANYIARTLEKQVAKLPKELQAKARKAGQTLANKRTKEQKALIRKHPKLNVTAGSLYLYDRKAADDLKAIAARAAKLRATKPRPDYVRALTEIPGKVPETFVFERGDMEVPRDKVTPSALTLFANFAPKPIPINDKKVPTTGRRLAFAEHLTSGKHPLVARVLVNRIWLHHFGRGIVNSPGDFGFLGERPSHPELLDWLADDFVRHGWKLKRMHKLIVTSTAYRQASQPTKKDPDNILLSRYPVRRLEAEVIRDSILKVSGKLNHKMFGKPVPVRVDPFGQIVIGVDTRDTAGRFTKKSVDLKGEEYRRSVYVQVRRSQPLAVLDTFDLPDMAPNCVKRNSSTVAPQALMLMNSQFIRQQAKLFAERLQKEAGSEAKAQLTLAWQLAFSRIPTAEQLTQSQAFLDRQTTLYGSQKSVNEAQAQQRALTDLCQALLSSNRFLYAD